MTKTNKLNRGYDKEHSYKITIQRTVPRKSESIVESKSQIEFLHTTKITRTGLSVP